MHVKYGNACVALHAKYVAEAMDEVCNTIVHGSLKTILRSRSWIENLTFYVAVNHHHLKNVCRLILSFIESVMYYFKTTVSSISHSIV